jgi:hypothetical protein
MAAAIAAMTKGGCRGTTALQGQYASLWRTANHFNSKSICNFGKTFIFARKRQRILKL